MPPIRRSIVRKLLADLFRVATTTNSTAYNAFLSYSHRVDWELARVFQSDLERFGGRFPWSRILRIYRDETNLEATPDSWSTIERALSKRATVDPARIAGIDAVQLDRELAHFVEHRGTTRLCIVVTLGKTPYTDADEIGN